MHLKDAKLKQELYAIAQTMVGMLLLTLVLAGIGGTVYKIVSPEGWVAQAFGRSASAGLVAVGSLLMVAGLAWFSRDWTSASAYRTRASSLLLYVFAGAGMLYVAQLWLGAVL
jgi:hypothetical protein